MKLIDTAACAGMIVLLIAGVSRAGSLEGPEGRGPMGPPPEAYEACAGKSEGDTVEMKTPRGDTIKAVCRAIRGKLAAVPEGMPMPPAGNGPSGNSR